MSGGSYHYAYRHIEELADDIEEKLDERCDGPLQKALRQDFIALLRSVAIAAKAIEWVDSGDSSSPRERDPLLKVLTPDLAPNFKTELKGRPSTTLDPHE